MIYNFKSSGIFFLICILTLSLQYGCIRHPAGRGPNDGTGDGMSGIDGTQDGLGDGTGTPGDVISITDMSRGVEIWKNSGCTRCHTIGDDPGGTSAPSLTGIGDRLTKDELKTWIRNPQAVRPEATMPGQNVPDEDLEYLARYLSLLSSDTGGTTGATGAASRDQ